jgi:hypothetical protein
VTREEKTKAPKDEETSFSHSRPTGNRSEAKIGRLSDQTDNSKS